MSKRLKDKEVVACVRKAGAKGVPVASADLARKLGADLDPRHLRRQIDQLVEAGQLKRVQLDGGQCKLVATR